MEYEKPPVSFVVGNTNKEAYNIIKTAIMDGSKENNPIILFGPNGVGKTHLLLDVTSQQGSKKTEYIHATDIIYELIGVIAHNINKKTNSVKVKKHFIKRFADFDVIIVDNLHSLANLSSMQEELYKIIDILIEHSKQIVLITDTPFEEYDVLFKKMYTGFEGLLVCKIEKPDNETKKKIIDARAEYLGLSFEDSAVEWLIKNFELASHIIGMMNKLAIIFGSKKSISSTDIIKEVIREQP